MKIIHVLDYLPYYHQKGGGAERASFNIIKLLESKNHQNIVLTLLPNLQPVEQQRFTIYSLKSQEKIVGYKLSFKKRIFNFDIFVFFQVLKILKKEKPDKIHLYNIPIISLAPILAAWLLKIPVYYFIYDYWPFCPAVLLLDDHEEICHQYNSKKCLECYKQKNLSEKINLIFRKKIHNFFLNKITRFITLSYASANVIKEYGYQNVAVVRLIVEDLNNLNKNFHSNVILYSGWLQRRKGLHVIIKALPQIVKAHSNALLYILNLQETPEYKQEIIELIKKHQLEKNIKWFAKLNREEFYQVFNEAGVIAIPEQWPNMSPVILLESMSAGKAIVASNIGGFPEFIENGQLGYLAKYNNSLDWAEKINSLLNNHEKIKYFGKNARKFFEANLNQDIIYQQLIDSYKI